MSEFSRDPFNNIIQEGIKGDIDFCVKHDRYRAVLTLIYAAMDQMAFLSMPEEQEDVTRTDFLNWVDRYLQMPYQHSPTSMELYGARCAQLHSYGVQSRLSREKGVRLIAHVDIMVPAVKYDAQVKPKYLILSIHALKESLFSGINKFMIDVHEDAETLSKVNKRLHWMLSLYDLRDPKEKQE